MILKKGETKNQSDMQDTLNLFICADSSNDTKEKKN